MNIDNCWYKSVCNNECSAGCVRYNCMHSLYAHSNLPESLWDKKVLVCNDNDMASFVILSNISRNINDWVAKGNNLYIYSKICGNGKTSWSIRLMHSYFDSIWHKSGFNCHGLFINVPSFLYLCKKSISHNMTEFDELCKLIDSVELVIWDDLPCSTFTGYEHQIILQHIDNRINAGLSNIFTGNCGKEECITLMGDRLASRVFGCSEIIEFVEGDKRGLNYGRTTDTK